MKILLDNGHGIDTPGKRSPEGLLREYAWNRLIASRIVTALTDLGHDAAYNRAAGHHTHEQSHPGGWL